MFRCLLFLTLFTIADIASQSSFKMFDINCFDCSDISSMEFTMMILIVNDFEYVLFHASWNAESRHFIR